VFEVTREPPARLLAERDDAFLSSFAAHVHELLLEVDVAEVEADSLRTAQAGGVDELDERTVPQRERPVAFELRERAVDLGGPGRIGQTA
jgi:hypothetical protein